MFRALNRVLMSRTGPILTGVAVGILAPLLTFWGNPGNMGICVACFTRDIAGALGLHRAATVQYVRPELAGFILGSFVSSLIYGEYKPRTGSSPIIRFFLGFFAMIGALVFLGCRGAYILERRGLKRRTRHRRVSPGHRHWHRISLAWVQLRRNFPAKGRWATLCPPLL